MWEETVDSKDTSNMPFTNRHYSPVQVPATPKVDGCSQYSSSDEFLKNKFSNKKPVNPDRQQREENKWSKTRQTAVRGYNRMQSFSSSTNLQLDPKDQKLKVPFESIFYPSLRAHNFLLPLQPFEDEIRDWLVDLIEITTSVGFNHLRKGTMTEKECKNFVSKNILQNIKELFEQLKEMPLEIRFKMMRLMNQESYQILDHLGHKYPQNSSKGVSRRIKSRVQAIDNRESDQFDFLFLNGTTIKYREDGDYSADIMQIINKLVSFANDPFQSQTDQNENNFEVFSEVMELIFSSQPVESATTEIVQTIQKKRGKIEEQICSSPTKRINGLFEQKLAQSSEVKRFSGKQAEKQVLIGQKIPSSVPSFSDSDIETRKFKTKDSSILRLLTKWAEELRNKITSAEESLYRRRFKFKNSRGRLINLQPSMKQHLYRAAIQEIPIIEEYLAYLKEQNLYLQTVFAMQISKGKHSKNDTKVGVFATKLNQIASQYIFKYINKLIHSLLRIPLKAAEQASSDREKAIIKSVDLITFKIGDMMRCKCACSEQQFLRIVNLIDSVHTQSPESMKIVRIKNRLQTQNTDILINFLFAGKAECELQLSVLSSEKREESTNSKFSHFIYELVRAELGPLSEMATIVVQYDPLTHLYSKLKNFGPTLQIAQGTTANQDNLKQTSELSNQMIEMKLGADIQLPFVCWSCRKLTVVYNPRFCLRNPSERELLCNHCMATSFSELTEEGKKMKQYGLEVNFKEESEKQFSRRHCFMWNHEQLISKLRRGTQKIKEEEMFSASGLMIRRDQTLPKIQHFTYLYDRTFSFGIFATKNEEGEPKLLEVIQMYLQKQKNIRSITAELSKFKIIQIKDSLQIREGNTCTYVCNRPNCCNLSLKVRGVLEREEMVHYKTFKILQRSIESQSNLLYLNYLPKSLQKLTFYLDKIAEKNQKKRIKGTVQIIEAFQCGIQNIEVVGFFVSLSDLNVANNPELKSLKGIESCRVLKYLNCSDCDIEDISQLSQLKKLETINLTNNKRITSVLALAHHYELLDVFLSKLMVSRGIRQLRVQPLWPIVTSWSLLICKTAI